MRLRRTAVACLPLLLPLTACGGGVEVTEATDPHQVPRPGDASSTRAVFVRSGELPSEDDVETYFEALASRDLDDLEAARELTLEGSVAYAVAEYHVAIVEAALDGGATPADLEADIEDVDGGYRVCAAPGECNEFTDIQGAAGKLVFFQSDGRDFTGRISLGTGEEIEVPGLGTVTFRVALERVEPQEVIVMLDVATAGEPIAVGLDSATYRDAEGRTTEASEDSMGPREVDAGSTVTVAIIFAEAHHGGTVTLPLSAGDGAEQDVTFAIR